METVKRVNKIWTNDSLFLRDYLLIPVSSQHAEDINSSSFNGASTALSISEISVKVEPAVKVLTRQDVKALQGSSKLASVQSKAVETISSEPTLNDFLNRVDNSLNKLRVDVERLDRSTEYVLFCTIYLLTFTKLNFAVSICVPNCTQLKCFNVCNSLVQHEVVC